MLGHQDVVHESLNHFRRVDFFQSGKISKGEGNLTAVSCSGNNILAVTKNGHLYGWGENSNRMVPQEAVPGVETRGRGRGA